MIPHRKDVVRKFQGSIDSLLYEKAVFLGLVDTAEEAEDKLRSLLWHAAPHKHPNGNRRYHNWVFLIAKDKLINIHRIKCGICEDQKRVVVYEECYKCEGAKCSRCNHTGELEGAIPCPECTSKK